MTTNSILPNDLQRDFKLCLGHEMNTNTHMVSFVVRCGFKDVMFLSPGITMQDVNLECYDGIESERGL
jgi:hypothetical protein